jgi:molybdopterin-containing oxidoreductase family membrane subunit
VFAVSTYFTVSVLFWYMGLIPDLAAVRDRAKSQLAKVINGILSWGWRNSAVHWMRFESAYLLLAGLSTPLVLSVHSVVSLDFAISIVPGWHVTIFPPYFVAGAIYSGFAMVLTLVIPFRILYPKLREYITMHHIDMMAKVMLATGLIVFYGYMMEAFFGFYSANLFEKYMITNRMTGPYWPVYWALIFCNGLVPQLLWFPKVRHNLFWLFIISLIVNTGMWLERFVIVVTSLHRDFTPSAWGMYGPTFWDWATYIGTLGFFVMMMFIFARFVPMLAMAELKDLWYRLYGHRGGHNGHAPAKEPTHAPTPGGGA